MIDILADQLSISKKDAMKKVLRGFIEKEGIDTTIKIPMRDLAVELLGCRGLVLGLLSISTEIKNTISAPPVNEELTAEAYLELSKQNRLKRQGRLEITVGNFIIHNDGTVTNTKTGLMWKQEHETEKLNWNDAIQHASKSHFAGYSDWRLPTIDELASLIDERFIPKINNSVFLNMPSGFFTIYIFWSSSPATKSATAWYVAFVGGRVDYNGMDAPYFVRLVRG